MKALTALAIGLAVISTTTFARDTYVKPHYRSNGTYVEGHYRSAPNSTKLDNYSTQGNYNPYTGVEGTRDPLKFDPYTAPKPRRY